MDIQVLFNWIGFIYLFILAVAAHTKAAPARIIWNVIPGIGAFLGFILLFVKG